MGDPVEGQGVPAGELQRMFDDYHIERHAEASNERVENHFGIGLSIARRNVEAMGGQSRRKPNTTRIGGPPSGAVNIPSRCRVKAQAERWVLMVRLPGARLEAATDPSPNATGDRVQRLTLNY
jgi:hypothetical protein